MAGLHEETMRERIRSVILQSYRVNYDERDERDAHVLPTSNVNLKRDSQKTQE